MNAIKFIQQHGIDKAREIVDGAPDRATTVKPSLDFKHFMYGICEEAGGAYILLSDLKRLVESVDIILELGGLRSAKANVREMYIDSSCDYVHPEVGLYDYKHLTVGRVKQAIADHEAIGGEHV